MIKKLKIAKISSSRWIAIRTNLILFRNIWARVYSNIAVSDLSNNNKKKNSFILQNVNHQKLIKSLINLNK